MFAGCSVNMTGGGCESKESGRHISKCKAIPYDAVSWDVT